MRKTIKEERVFGEIAYEFDVTYQQDSHVEEGHGFHTLYEDEEISRKLTKAYILLESGEVIDLTMRLRKDEIKLITDSYV